MTERRSVRRAVLRDLRAITGDLAGSAEALAALRVAELLDEGALPAQVPNLTRELRLLMAGLRAAQPRPGTGDPLEELRRVASEIP